MTPQEKELILNVANKLKQSPKKNKDADAESLISNEIASQEDAIYKLTQAVLVQEMALKELKQKNDYLEQCVEHHKTEANRGALSKMMGGSRPEPMPPRPVHQPSAFGSFMQTAASVAVGMVAGHMISNALFGNDDPAAETAAADTASADAAAADTATADSVTETASTDAAQENTGGFLDDSSSFASDYTDGSTGFGNAGFEESGFGSAGFDDSFASADTTRFDGDNFGEGGFGEDSFLSGDDFGFDEDV